MVVKWDEGKLFEEYDRFLWKTVHMFRKMYKYDWEEIEDFYQVTRLAFLKHARATENRDALMLCSYDLIRAMYDYIEEINFIKIPHYCFWEEVKEYKQVNIGAMQLSQKAPSEFEVLYRLEYNAFLESLAEDKRNAYLLKEAGYKYREIVSIMGLRNIPQLERMLQSVEKDYKAFAKRFLGIDK